MINPFEMAKKIGDMKKTIDDMHLDELLITGESGGGLVKVTVNGKLEMTQVIIDPIAVDKRDVAMLQDLIVSAHNDAMAKMMAELKNKLGSELGGIPGLAGLTGLGL